ncbi:hypothetical protein MrNuV_ORF083 [Macrobrachium rosenbergii nudivirus]|nr:hypothetical protein MrNuV_ORF083 [Macrobrachium rosenbergii nudivirus]
MANLIKKSVTSPNIGNSDTESIDLVSYSIHNMEIVNFIPTMHIKKDGVYYIIFYKATNETYHATVYQVSIINKTYKILGKVTYKNKEYGKKVRYTKMSTHKFINYVNSLSNCILCIQNKIENVKLPYSSIKDDGLITLNGIKSNIPRIDNKVRIYSYAIPIDIDDIFDVKINDDELISLLSFYRYKKLKN